MSGLIFLPGAAGAAAFWRPVADRLPPDRPKRLFSWPGLGEEPHDPAVGGLDDLVGLVLAELREPANLIAQSMGGLVAMRVALAAPQLVRRLVLTVTSAGVAVGDLGGVDWRSNYRRRFPQAAAWISEPSSAQDLSPRLPTVTAPALLIWGDADPISPPAVGERLRQLLPDARLHVVRGGDHDLAVTHAAEIAPIIADFLG